MDSGGNASQIYRMRPLRPEDVPAVAHWYERVEDLALFHQRLPLPVPGEAVLAAWRESLLASEPRTSYWYGLHTADGSLCGFGGIEDISHVHGSAVTPLFLAPEVRRRGLSVPMRALLLDLAFDQLRLARITSFHRADNAASRRLNERCGLRPEGTLRKAWFASGRFTDLSVFGILADEWRAHRDSLRRTLPGEPIVVLGDSVDAAWLWPGAGTRRAAASHS